MHHKVGSWFTANYRAVYEQVMAVDEAPPSDLEEKFSPSGGG